MEGNKPEVKKKTKYEIENFILFLALMGMNFSFFLTVMLGRRLGADLAGTTLYDNCGEPERHEQDQK